MAALGKFGLAKLRDGVAAAASGGKSSQGEMQQALHLLRDFEQSGHGWFWSTDAGGRI
ncbi:MAG: hypothetical protein JF595_14115, partial [Sphingomonadales bacterium]|nr:hypothetical protein [Sphingomonadales bacterium]